MLKQGTQIIYVPMHAKEEINHPDCEAGFVTSVTAQDGCRVRNVIPRPNGNCSCADCASLERASTINKEESHAQSPA